ncbi:MAG: DUF3299 domain-containing protein [Litoreibacter sp.]
MNRNLRRRAVLAGLTVSTLMPNTAKAKAFVDLGWEDLIPKDQLSIPAALRSLLPHDETAPLISLQPASSGVRPDWNDRIVRIPGFIVPIDYSGTGVTAFILVPYVGACVHVPPPPANQLIFVTTTTPYENEGLFEAVNVTGIFGVSSLTTHLADVGYALSADNIEPYHS